jgi:hypothetical protein
MHGTGTPEDLVKYLERTKQWKLKN